jgi:hypothetical protein
MTSQKRIQSLFEQFTSLANIPTTAIWKPEIKNWSNRFLKMDFNSAYGGYRIDWVEVGTGESFFSFSSRFNNKEMASYLQGLIEGYALAKEIKL